MVAAGMDVARLNFSHGTHDSHAILIELIRKISIEMNRPIAILQDLQGPKLRVGDLPADGIMLKVGETVYLYSIDSPAPVQMRRELFWLGRSPLNKSVKKGNRILLDDGNLN
jgi:pyruvate kinase